MDFPVNPTEDELSLAWNHAGELVAKYDWLTARTVLARLLTGTYRNPPGRPGLEYRDGEIPSDSTVSKALQLYSDMHSSAIELQKLVDYPRKLLKRVVNFHSTYRFREINSGILAMMHNPPCAEPRSHASTMLVSIAHTFGRYVLLITNRSVAHADKDPNAESQRAFLGDVLRLTGWAFDEAEIDVAWSMAAQGTYGDSAKSAGLRLTREERAELKAWYAARAID